EWQHALRRLLVTAVAETVKACRCPSQINDDQEKRGQRVEAEMRTKPRQPDWQDYARGIDLAADQKGRRGEQGDCANRQRGAVNDGGRTLCAAQNNRQNCQPEQSGDTRHLQSTRCWQNNSRHYLRALVLLDALLSDRAPRWALAESESSFSRTPRPCELLTAPSSIISIP